MLISWALLKKYLYPFSPGFSSLNGVGFPLSLTIFAKVFNKSLFLNREAALCHIYHPFWIFLFPFYSQCGNFFHYDSSLKTVLNVVLLYIFEGLPQGTFILPKQVPSWSRFYQLISLFPNFIDQCHLIFF